MIGKLKGIVDSHDDGAVILDVGGVGYLVFGSSRTLGALTKGEAVSLLIETHVREDHIHLFGFLEAAERNWFRLLLNIQGVGTKHALSILSVLSPDQLTQAIAAQDKTALTRASGVGPKLAGRLVLELKDKVANLSLGQGAALAAEAGGSVNGGAGGAADDAVSALVNLGYRRAEAFTAVAKAAREQGEGASVESLIREGLKELAS
ncbi:Holliday junction branch migration protein RuvA [Limibacillus halophilus]|jgi:Holliday junction DNA helicase RuvA